jgi:hypothetical protein
MCVCVCVSAHACVRIYVCIRVRDVCVFAYVYVRARAYMCTCPCVHMCMWVCGYVGMCLSWCLHANLSAVLHGCVTVDYMRMCYSSVLSGFFFGRCVLGTSIYSHALISMLILVQFAEVKSGVLKSIFGVKLSSVIANGT